MSGARTEVAVVGGGISGLAAAFDLAAAGVPVTLLEREARVGGVLRSHAEGGWLFELGANTVLAPAPLTALLATAGLGDEVETPAPAARRRYLWRGERLVALPAGPLSLLTSRLLPARAKLALLREPFVPPLRGGEEESIAAFVRRRLGQPWLDYAVGPLVSGIYAGDPERLSLRAALPRLAALERRHGSLLRGALASGRRAAPGDAATARGTTIGFSGGFARLAAGLAATLPDLRLSTPVLAVERAAAGFLLRTAAGELTAAQLVLALPADAVAELLAATAGEAATGLSALAYAPLLVAALGYRREQVRHPLDGFGFLAPRRESLRLLGGLFSSTLFPGRAPAGHVALTAFAGGVLDRELVVAGEEEIWRAVEGDLGRALGIAGPPVYRHLCRWPRAIPQYELGHQRFVGLAAELERRLPGLHLAGNWIDGVSVADAAARGAAVARRVLARRGEAAAPAAC